MGERTRNMSLDSCPGRPADAMTPEPEDLPSPVPIPPPRTFGAGVCIVVSALCRMTESGPTKMRSWYSYACTTAICFIRSGEAVNKTVKYVIGRLLFLIPIMLILSFFVFALTYLSPSDPVMLKFQLMGEVPDPAVVEQAREEMGLNDPFLVQYGRWLWKALHGDLGESYKTGVSVWKTMLGRIPNTLKLTGATLLLTVLLAVPLGVLSAVYQNRFVDYLLRFISFFGVSMPSFWVGFLLMYLFGIKLKLLPVMGSGDIRHLILPSMTLAFWMISLYVRRVRGSMLEEMNKDYLNGGLARGLPKRQIIFQQILPNSLLSVITMFGMSIGGLMGGATIIETIFEWKGIGKMAVDAIAVKDFPIIQGYILWMAVIYVVINLIVDLLYRFLDPRIRLEG